MSLFDNTKVVGWGLFIVGIVAILSALLQLYEGITGDDALDAAVVGIGVLIAAFIYFGFGNKVRKGVISEKIDILALFIKTYGYATIVSAFFSLVAGLWSTEISAWSSLVMLILGIIVVWIGGKVNDNKATNFDRILWIALLIIFFVLLILELVAIFDDGATWITIIGNILFAIIYLYMVAFLLDGDVRKKMKM